VTSHKLWVGGKTLLRVLRRRWLGADQDSSQPLCIYCPHVIIIIEQNPQVYLHAQAYSYSSTIPITCPTFTFCPRSTRNLNPPCPGDPGLLAGASNTNTTVEPSLNPPISAPLTIG
jgi:hypothetical protein